MILQKKEQAIVTILLDSKRILKNKANVPNINSVGNIKSSAQENKNPMCAFFQSVFIETNNKTIKLAWVRLPYHKKIGLWQCLRKSKSKCWVQPILFHQKKLCALTNSIFSYKEIFKNYLQIEIIIFMIIRKIVKLYS